VALVGFSTPGISNYKDHPLTNIKKFIYIYIYMYNYLLKFQLFVSVSAACGGRTAHRSTLESVEGRKLNCFI
jgi:hypothetical protein